MTISRRDLIKVGMTAGAALSMPSVLRAQTAPTDARTVRMALGNLQIFDPHLAGTDPTVFHGLAIYDTLFSLDSKYVPQPQMVGKWGVSDDKKTYTFELRDGLGWHDGTPVTAADCVASIRRWGQVAPTGKLIMARAKGISKKDDKTFSITLKEPLGILTELLTELAAPVPFIMREKDADRPATEQVTANIGSGPFKFNNALAKPGANFTYDRNEKYVPRSDASDGYAGAKVAKVDRVIWDFAEANTALAALQAGELDFARFPPADLYSTIESDPNLVLQVMNKSGNNMCLRMNHLQKPFDNVKARQAMLHLIDQEAFLRVTAPDPRYRHTLTSIFGNTTPYSNDENTSWFKKGGDPEKAKQLFKEAGYAGEKIVILDPTDWAQASNASQLLASELRKIGVNAELASSDWNSLEARRKNKGPVESGGWSIYITDDFDHTQLPITASFLRASGDTDGGLKNDEFEALRLEWLDLDTLEERKLLARKMQRIWWDFVGDVRLGQMVTPIARRKTLTGLIEMPYIAFWNLQKVSG
ncbi:ABC transporter substrate-binding protein [Mesorhizobium sp.]|uniref:ABC transporter substrate-binding protein n=1 Tax=Mesorhizobium sp. TaxID=1871066 RepID=UPI000FE7FC55|nr:ABC transporter substrate-binding protein [Mesorhizobium sp.]RWI99983.1 MAG: ABC transporter substrate-binding protein [Mesorhizobium sp.]RWM04972.1 MAG: ABC transporter substrate-binding protein [Mesorhizobium sp.]RWO82176.1 MAG: ABC transporter substrate-binding protein [Mesorhizobium sp.]